MQPLCVGPEEPIHSAIQCIDACGCGIALVADTERRLLATITDSDIRRAILADQDLEVSVGGFLAARPLVPHSTPVTAAVGTAPEILLDLMTSQFVRQIPLLDAHGRLADLAVIDDFLPSSIPGMRAVIMAGGLGTRLRPFTDELPKPMLPVGGRPLMEHIIEQLSKAGIRDVHVSTHYKPEHIINHFGDGRAFGINLTYLNEEQPLGTAGALGLLSLPKGTQLVINGDILTQINFGAMLAFHQEHRAEMTVGVRRYDVQVPYGVIECEGTRVSSLTEKPQLSLLVNAGVYLLEPSVYELIPRERSFNMTDLIGLLLDAGRAVISFPIREYWLDVGQHTDYSQAQNDIKNGRLAQ